MPQRKVWAGTSSVKGSNESIRMALLTVCLAGLQFTWGMEMTYCMPYLLELGLTKSKTSLVWLAGPLSGIIMAPLVGALADRCTSSWGRRRPFMIGGAIVLTAFLFVLGWSKEIVQLFLGEEASNGTPTIVLAVSSIYAVDFAINAVQWGSRSIIVDTLPTSKQQKGMAWGAGMVAIGHLVGYLFGALDLEKIFGNALGGTQFKRVIVLAIIGLDATVAATCWAVTEMVLLSDGYDKSSRPGMLALFKDIILTAVRMPRKMKAICWVQFWSYLGWFPFMFYGSEFLGEIYLKYEADPTQPIQDLTATIGRIGSTALIVFSVVTTISNLVLPMFIQSPDEDDRVYTPRPPSNLAPVMEKVAKSKPTLLTAWFLGQFVFAAPMLLAPFAKSVWFASLLIAVCGVPWALTSWAPHAFMGAAISSLGRSANTGGGEARGAYGSVPHIELPEDDAGESPGEYQSGDSGNDDNSLSGIYLGILNMYTTMAQFLGAFISGLVFLIFEPGKGLPGKGKEGEGAVEDGYNGIGICLFIAALSALVAAGAARRLKQISSPSSAS